MCAQQNVPIVVDLNMLLSPLIHVNKMILSIDVHGFSLIEHNGGLMVRGGYKLVNFIIIELKVTLFTRNTQLIVNEYYSIDYFITNMIYGFVHSQINELFVVQNDKSY